MDSRTQKPTVPEASGGDSASRSDPSQLHGSLVEVCDLGVLILGPSGVGKSECVIELVRRGQRMVADDVVRLSTRESGTRLFGRSPKSIRHHIEIRGLGLLSVAELYGDAAVLDEREIEFICRLEGRREGGHYERIGLERPREEILGVSLPTVTLPVHAAASLATLVELAARDWNLRRLGINAAKRLDERLRRRGGMFDSADGSTDDTSPVDDSG